MGDNEKQASLRPSPIFTSLGEEDFPSFASRDGSSIYISVAEDCLQSLRTLTNLEDQEADDFEFTFFADQDLDAASNVGSVGQVFPVFNTVLVDGDSLACTTEAVHLPLRQLLVEERNASSRSSTSSSSASVDDMDGILSDSFCLWEPRSLPPSPKPWKKSKSTGSLSRRWRLRDLVFGRSHSDGKDKLDFLAEERNGAKSSPGKEEVKGKKKKTDTVKAHKVYYAKAGGGGQRQDIVGFFGKAYHPS